MTSLVSGGGRTERNSHRPGNDMRIAGPDRLVAVRADVGLLRVSGGNPVELPLTFGTGDSL